MRYIFVINGREDKAFIQNEITAQLQDFKGEVDYDIYITKAPRDATRHVSLYCDLHKGLEVCFIACGGDGTVNEVATGLVGADEFKSMAIMAYGTGNDFIKYYEGRDFKSLARLFAGERRRVDILRINNSFSLNVCYFGFDSIVAASANRLNEKGRKAPYKAGLMAAVLRGRFNHIKVTADGKPLNKEEMLLCTMANGRFVGGEFLCAPRSANDDGLIDICLIRPMPLMTFFQMLPVYTRGEHLDDPKFAKYITCCQAKTAAIESRHQIEVCLDGEMIADKTFNVRIIPEAISLVIPAE